MTNRTKSAPGQRTRQRILDVTLALYNERGEPQVSTSLIATELGISAGNLHYHFRRKDALSAALLDRFVDEFDAVLPPASWRAGHVEDAWLLLHLLLETVWRYRFLFRDLSGIMARDRRAAQRLAGVFARAVEAARHPRQELRSAGMARGTYQVLMLVAPFLQVESRIHLERLAEGYLARR